MVTTNQKSMMDTHKKGERNPNIALKTIVIILNGKSVKQEDRNKKELEKQKTVNKMTVPLLSRSWGVLRHFLLFREHS